jgi:ABC-type Fe3+ transport system substrate-binding protein
MLKRISILSCVALIVAVPFLFKKNTVSLEPVESDGVVVIVTAHNETLRSEYGRGFTEWYKKKTGKLITVDWRHPGGGREVERYIDSIYTNNFRLYWEETLGKPWTQETRAIFARLENITDENATPQEKEVRDAFFNSNVSCDIDLLFGGGVFSHKLQGAKGYTVSSGIVDLHPELFTDDKIPEFFAGERLWDRESRWVGGSLSSFGIIYNKDAVNDIGAHYPETWMDLADPKFYQGIAIVDPTKSSSTLKSFEMLIQQQMQIRLAELTNENTKNDTLQANENSKENINRSNDNAQLKEKYQLTSAEIEYRAIREGWMNGLKLIQKIVANGRYMTDSSAQTVLDVAAGNCPVGIATDFYGRSEKSHIKSRGGEDRFEFIIPRSGCSPSPDPISLFRGAKHKELALEFLEYVLSEPGQSLLTFRVGEENGPYQVPLCRAAILKTIYNDDKLQYHDDPGINPYEDACDFIYREEWTKPVFGSIGLIFKLAFLDPNDVLIDARAAILKAEKEGRINDAQRAMEVLSDLSYFDYDDVQKTLVKEAKNKDPLKAIQYQTDLANKFREQYRCALSIAKGKKKT